MNFSINKKLKKIITYLFSAAVIILIWIIAARIINSSLILPFPKAVFFQIIKNLKSGVFWISFFYTFIRLISAFLISLVSGVFFGILCAESSFVEDFLQIPLTIVSSTPVVAMILIMLFWFPSDFVPVAICVIMTLPIIITATKTGIKNTNPASIFFAKSRNFGYFHLLRYVKLPNARINILEGGLRCFSLSWKVIIAGEVLCLPRNAIGSLIQKSQIHLETADVMANTIILVTISFILELLLKKTVKSLELKIQNN